jgi:hypothetical protein
MRILTGLACITCAVMLGACGHVQRVQAGRVLRVGLTEYRLVPQDVRVKAGQLTIDVHNYGRLTHNLVISSHGWQAASTQPLLPGQDSELVMVATPGKYLMASTILSDQTLGTYGTLTVTR